MLKQIFETCTNPKTNKQTRHNTTVEKFSCTVAFEQTDFYPQFAYYGGRRRRPMPFVPPSLLLLLSVAKDYVRLMKYGDSLYRCKQLKRAALGRMCTILKRQKSSLEYLEQGSACWSTLTLSLSHSSARVHCSLSIFLHQCVSICLVCPPSTPTPGPCSCAVTPTWESPVSSTRYGDVSPHCYSGCLLAEIIACFIVGEKKKSSLLSVSGDQSRRGRPALCLHHQIPVCGSHGLQIPALAGRDPQCSVRLPTLLANFHQAVCFWQLLHSLSSCRWWTPPASWTTPWRRGTPSRCRPSRLWLT